MRFESPWMLLTLVLLAGVVALWVVAGRRRMRYAVRYTNLDVLASVASERAWRHLVPAALVLLSLTALLVALARPHVDRELLVERATVILVIDTSRSMQAEDVEPTRLAAAQEAARTFLDEVPDDLRVGLVVFAGEAQVATPPTTDHELVRDALTTIDSFLIFGGTAIGDALERGVDLAKRATGDPPGRGEEISFQAAPPTRTLAQVTGCPERSPASILFLSDGAQTRGFLQPLEGAELARDACIPVYTVALGTPEGTIDRGSFGFPDPGQLPQRIPVPPDPETLRSIAEMTGGEFTEAQTAESLEGAYANLGSRLGREPGEAEATFLLLGLAAVLLVAAGVLSAFVAPRLP
ncbi:MAG: VWA domain-containing protein [Gaiellaceae bacterium]